MIGRLRRMRAAAATLAVEPAQAELTVGDPLAVRVRLTAHRPCRVTSVRVSLELGRRQPARHLGGSPQMVRDLAISATLPTSDDEVIAPGTVLERDVVMPVPGLPPTASGERVGVEYRLCAEAVLASGQVIRQFGPPLVLRSARSLYRTVEGSPSSAAPRMPSPVRLGLDPAHARPGDSITCMVEVDSDQPQPLPRVQLALVRSEGHGTREESRAVAHEALLADEVLDDAAARRNGRTAHYRVAVLVPLGSPATFFTPTSWLRWYVRATITSADAPAQLVDREINVYNGADDIGEESAVLGASASGEGPGRA